MTTAADVQALIERLRDRAAIQRRGIESEYFLSVLQISDPPSEATHD